jgi:hypothetical protein
VFALSYPRRQWLYPIYPKAGLRDSKLQLSVRTLRNRFDVLTEDLMRATMLTVAFGAVCMAWVQIPAVSHAQTALLQSNTDLSAAAKRKRPASPNTVYQPRPHFGGPADPSFGPDGKPYRVPEYLRNQCYIDDGYGRFSACSSRT